MILAITGGTGFVGGRLIERATKAGHAVRALARKPQPAREGVIWITGALDAPDALATLIEGADAVVHVAGVVNAADRAGFAAGNVEGTRAMIAATEATGVSRFIHVSSLAAREPGLSDYGWSKAESDRAVEGSPLAWTILRPPGVYGPGDMEMRDVFRLAKRGLALLPPPGLSAWIAVDDLARLLLAFAEQGGPRTIYEADDGGPALTHVALAHAIGDAVGRRILPITLPAALLSFAARLDRRFRGSDAKLTPDRAAYLSHPDWTTDPARRPPASLWTPQISLSEGLAETAQWYRAHGLL